MLKVLTKEEELKGRRERFAKLRRGSLFDLAQERFFIAIEKIDERVWEVVELTGPNKERIILGRPCERSQLHFDQMNCLNLHEKTRNA